MSVTIDVQESFAVQSPAVVFAMRGAELKTLVVVAAPKMSGLPAIYAGLAAAYARIPAIDDSSGGLPGDPDTFQLVHSSREIPAARIYVEPEDELLQGDIFRNVPAIHIASRPVRVARHYKDTEKGVLYGVHDEDGRPPKDDFRWHTDQGGESVIAKGFMGMAVVISHDCEIENDPNHRLVAMIRAITEIQEQFRADIMAMNHWAAFPLLAQNEAPAMEDSFVDFRWITSLRPTALRPEDRFARLAPPVLDAMRVRFWHFLNRRVIEPPAAPAT